ncbi:MAG: hypothetical protein WKF85_00955 [Chitinophagaceae bacterium]
MKKLFIVAPYFPPSSMSPAQRIRFIVKHAASLEKLLSILDNCKDQLQLTLIGHVRTFFYSNEIKDRSYISIKSSLPSKNFMLL